MEKELKTASVLQSTVLITPEVNSSDFRLANCYIPATECSGDFLDTFMVGRTLYFAVADATGHGAAAAIVTGVAKSCLLTLRNLYADQLPKPEQVLANLNRVIHGTCQGKLMMTMCLVQLDLDTGELRVANAGHEAPLCLRAGEGEGKKKPEEFFVRGERLGFAVESVFTGETFTLAAGDTLLLYTDGVSEAVNAEGAEWGERQLKKVFTKALTSAQTVETARDSILRELRSFIGSEPPHDDVTFSLLQYTPSNVKKAAA
jgi:sigma-B regulation protein RsbU (phosphoserine phosphatase)